MPPAEVCSGSGADCNPLDQQQRIERRKPAFGTVMRADGKAISGGCACGAVSFTRAGPLRIRLCHCMTCRKAHAFAFNPFAVFEAGAVEIAGELRSWSSSPGYVRQFCKECGSRVIALSGDEVEISLGSLDEPGVLEPQYESWITRREPWLAPLSTPQHAQERQ